MDDKIEKKKVSIVRWGDVTIRRKKEIIEFFIYIEF